MQKPDVQAAIEQADAEEREHCQSTKEKLLRELGKIAYMNLGAFVKVAGNTDKLMRLADVAATDKAALNSISTGKGGIRVTAKEKTKALELIAKISGWLDSTETPKPRPRPIIRIPTAVAVPPTDPPATVA